MPTYFGSSGISTISPTHCPLYVKPAMSLAASGEADSSSVAFGLAWCLPGWLLFSLAVFVDCFGFIGGCLHGCAAAGCAASGLAVAGSASEGSAAAFWRQRVWRQRIRWQRIRRQQVQ